MDIYKQVDHKIGIRKIFTNFVIATLALVISCATNSALASSAVANTSSANTSFFNNTSAVVATAAVGSAIGLAAIIGLLSNNNSNSANSGGIITGTVTTADHKGLAHVRINLMKSADLTAHEITHTTTDQQGNYEFTDLVSGNYTVIPTVTAGYSFKQYSKAAIINNNNAVNLNFTGVPVASGSFALSGKLNLARFQYSATLLRNGLVLVSGGFIDVSNNVTNSSELYDPATGKWTYTNGSMTTARTQHTTTLLPNGQVLVTGGFCDNSGSITDTAELYDPATDKWTAARSMTEKRTFHTATLLRNGQVLVVGGHDDYINDTRVKTAELYNPATDKWTAAESMTKVRSQHTTTILSNGQVLVAGGTVAGRGIAKHVSTNSVELYNPATGAWTTANKSMNIARANHIAILFPDGQILVAGGDDDAKVFVTAELYNPTTSAWTIIEAMTMPRAFNPAALLPNGQVLVLGGVKDVKLDCNDAAELYNPATGLWAATGKMIMPRAFNPAILLPNGQVLVPGGTYDAIGNVLATTELYSQ